MNAWDVLREKVKLEKEKVAVIGGGLIGCEVTEYLLEFRNEVTIVEQLFLLASDMEPMHRLDMLERFKENKNVVMAVGRKVVGVDEKGIQVVNLDNNKMELIEADRVVVAVGTKPADTLVNALEGKVKELYSLGDCNQPRVIMEAIYEGSLVGRQI